jgi:hypothetical protein
MLDCEFSVPIELGEGDFEFSQVHCTSTLYEQISNATTGAEFYIDKTISYGDAVLFWFFTIFLIAGIVVNLFKIFWKR